LPAACVVIAAPPVGALAAELVKAHQTAGCGKAVVHGQHARADDGIEAVKDDAAILSGVEPQIDQAAQIIARLGNTAADRPAHLPRQRIGGTALIPQEGDQIAGGGIADAEYFWILGGEGQAISQLWVKAALDAQ